MPQRNASVSARESSCWWTSTTMKMTGHDRWFVCCRGCSRTRRRGNIRHRCRTRLPSSDRWAGPRTTGSSLSVRNGRRIEHRDTYTGALKTKGAAVGPWRDVVEAFAAVVERISGTTVRVGVVGRFPLRMWSGAVAPARGWQIFSPWATQTTSGGDFGCQCQGILGWPWAPQRPKRKGAYRATTS